MMEQSNPVLVSGDIVLNVGLYYLVPERSYLFHCFLFFGFVFFFLSLDALICKGGISKGFERFVFFGVLVVTSAGSPA